MDTPKGAITDLVIQAYNAGLLQYHPLVVCGLNVTMNMFQYHNMLTVTYGGKLLSVSVYDSDSPETQESTIQNLIADILV